MISKIEKPKIFYGWHVVGAMFFMSFVSIGARQGFSVFVSSWVEEFSVSLGTISIIAAVGWVINGVSSPIFGVLTDRYGGRKVMAASMLVLGLFVWAIVFSPNIWVLGIIYAFFISFAMGGVLFISSTQVVVKWFRSLRGRALGVMTSGGSLGGMLLVPFMAYLLTMTNWRVTWAVLGAIMVFLAFPLILMVVRNAPEEMGLHPDGVQRSEKGAQGGLVDHLGPLAVTRWQTAFRSNPMWLLSISYVVCGITTGALGVHFVPFAEDQGVSIRTAALAFGLLMGFNLLGVLGVGTLSDKLLRKDVLAAIYFVRGIAFLFLVFLPASTGIWVFAFVGGVSWLASVPLTSALAAEIYGVKKVGTIVGILTLVHQLGGGASILLAGLIFDWTGTYTVAFTICAATCGLATLMAVSVRERKYSSRFLSASSPSASTA